MRLKDVTPGHLADAMGLEIDTAWGFARGIADCYKPRQMRCIQGKHRPIDALYSVPKRRLKKLHRFFQRGGFFHPRAHGGITGRSCFTSTSPRWATVCLDPGCFKMLSIDQAARVESRTPVTRLPGRYTPNAHNALYVPGQRAPRFAN